MHSGYLLYWYKSTNTDAVRAMLLAVLSNLYSICLLYWHYWYKSTNTDAVRAMLLAADSTREGEQHSR